MRGRLWGAAVGIGVAAVAGFFIVRGLGDKAKAAQQPQAPVAIPVTTVHVTPRDVPIYLRGLGLVQAFNSVQVRAQVNGTLLSIPVQEGQEVKQGDVVAVIDPKPYQATLDQAMAQRQGDQAQLESAKLDLGRYQDLAKKSFAPVQQVDQQRANVDKLTASVQADSAAIETAQINLGYTQIHAPFDGRIGLRETDVGNLIEVANQTNIISITQDRPISVVFTLPESELNQVKSAMAKGALPVEAHEGDAAAPMATGELLAPNNAIDTSTGTIQLKATFANADEKLWPGEFVQSWLHVDTNKNVVAVPIPAIQHGPSGLFVFVVKPGNTVEQRTVTVSYQDQGLAVIGDGVKPEEDVVLTGQSRLAPGAHVEVKKPAEAERDTAPKAG